ncbi:unnamed protein product [Absidia cylindrospora]
MGISIFLGIPFFIFLAIQTWISLFNDNQDSSLFQDSFSALRQSEYPLKRRLVFLARLSVTSSRSPFTQSTENYLYLPHKSGNDDIS